MSLKFFKVNPLDKKYTMGCSIKCFVLKKNDLQNQVPLGHFLARGAKSGYMTEKHCPAVAIVIKIFPNQL